MDNAAYLSHLRRELDEFAGCLGDDLSVPVEHCGDWTVYDLADHLGRGGQWTAAAVTERRGSYRAPPAPREPEALRTWFDQTCTLLLAVLDTDPAAEAWTFFPPHTVGFWQRRRCLEALVHRCDIEHAYGKPSTLDPALATDGVSEVFDTMAPRQAKRGAITAPPHAVGFIATDTAASWTYGDGEPVATARGAAADLLLMLWNRIPTDDDAITWHGDRDAGRQVLAIPLVP